MSFNLKKQRDGFNLYFLDYGEDLFNTITCYFHSDKNFYKGKLHLLNSSIILDSDTNANLTKIFYTKTFKIKSYSKKELIKCYRDNIGLFQSFKPVERGTFNKAATIDKTTTALVNKNRNSYYGSYNYRKFATIGNYGNEGNTSNLPLSHLKKTNDFISSNFKYKKGKNFEENLFSFFEYHKENNAMKRNLTNSTEFLNSSLNIYFSDLCSYFDNSIYKVGIFLQLIHERYKEKNFEDKYIQLILVECNKYELIDRENFVINKKEDNSDENIIFNTSFFLIIVEDEKQKIKEFNESISVLLNGIEEEEESMHNHSKQLIDLRLNKLRNQFFYHRDDETLLLDETESHNKIHIEFCAKCTRIQPDKFQSGLFIIYKFEEISNSYPIEFIPINNSLPFKKFKTNSNKIKVCLSFRFLFRYKAINLFFYNKKNSKIFDFEQQEDFTYIYNFLSEKCTNLDKDYHNIKYHTNLWVDGLLSNFDYLMYLNTMSSRSINDLSQYPIFPWTVINFNDKSIDLNNKKNYRDLSVPIGAINPKRLKIYKDKFDEIGYLYRNYLSYPYIVYYYLMRSHPLLFLRYQGGTFGPADRMFISLKDCWNVTYNNLGLDIKELTPEFYDSSSSGEFLKNIYNIDFGNTQGGVQVNDAILPPWAQSPRDFICTMRAALESEVVSNTLHEWIDLIFGYKQKGKNSIESNNVYCQLRYENCIFDVLENSGDQQKADLDDIIECGQIPIQIFDEPHPKKRSKVIFKEINELNFESDGTNKKIKEKELYKQKKQRIIIENKYEKERRDKDNQTDKIKKLLNQKQKMYDNMITNLYDTIKKKEVEFKAYKASLTKYNKSTKKAFNEYKEKKEKIAKEWIKDVNNKNDAKIKKIFSNDKPLLNSIKNLKEIVEKYEKRRKEYEEIGTKLDKKYEEIILENKRLREEQYNKKNIIRSFPLQIKNQL